MRKAKPNISHRSLPRRLASSSARAWPGPSASVARIIREACLYHIMYEYTAE